MPNLSFSIVKLQRSVIRQIASAFKDKSIGALKITYAHHPWIKGCPLCIRKALSGTCLILYFLKIHISAVHQIDVLIAGPKGQFCMSSGDSVTP